MPDIITEITNLENGTISFIGVPDKESVLPRTAELVQELLDKWNLSVAVFSLTSSGEALQALVKSESPVARLFIVNQKNADPQVILRKALGMANRKFVRAVIIEGPDINPESVAEWESHLRHWKATTVVVVGEHKSN